MADQQKKPEGPSKADQVTALRLKRYMEKGAGAKVKVESNTTKRIAMLQQLVDAVSPTKSRAQKKTAKKRRSLR